MTEAEELAELERLELAELERLELAELESLEKQSTPTTTAPPPPQQTPGQEYLASLKGMYSPVTNINAIVPQPQPPTQTRQIAQSPAKAVAIGADYGAPQKPSQGGIAATTAAMSKARKLKEMEAREPEARKVEEDWEKARSAVFYDNNQKQEIIEQIENEIKTIDPNLNYKKPDGSEITAAEYLKILEDDKRILTDEISSNRKYVDSNNANVQDVAFSIRQPKEYEKQKQQKELDSIKKEYEDYTRAFNVAYKASRQHEVNLPNGNLLEALFGETINGKKRATPEQFMRWKAGRINVGDIGDLWLPEAKIEDTTAGKIGQAAGNLTYGITKIPRTFTRLEDEYSAIKRAQAVKEGYVKQDQINEIKSRQEKGETISDDDKKFLIENDKNAAEEFWEGVKSIPELLKSFNEDPRALPEFVNDMVAYWPATAGVGAAVKAGASGISSAVKLAWQAKKAMAAGIKAKGIEQNAERAREVVDRWKKSQGGYAAKAELRKDVVKNPLSLKTFAIDYGKSATEEALAEALVETGYGEQFDVGSVMKNLGEDLGMQGLPSAVLRVTKRILQDKKGIVTNQEFNAAYGTHGAGFAKSTKMSEDGTPGINLETEGNVKMDVGTGNGIRDIGKSIETLRVRPDIWSETKKLAELRNNADYTAQEKYRFLDSEPEGKKEVASQTQDFKKGREHIAGFRENDINNITPSGNIGTIAHETLHGLEYHPELRTELAEWKANVKRWAIENGKEIPSNTELVAQTFAHRLGYPEPAEAEVKDIPVPDDLLQKVKQAVGEGKAGIQLRGEKFAHAKEDSEQEDVSRETSQAGEVWENGEYQGYRTEDGDMLPFSLKGNETKFSLIGRKGAEALDKTEEKTVRMDNLKTAKEMERVGKDAKAIWLATGWEQGKDGYWRYEVPDIKVDEYALKRAMRGMIGEQLGEIVSDNNLDLFKAYPEMKDMWIGFEDMKYGEFGHYNPDEKTIYINKNISMKEIRNTLIHEIQHAIQYREGFTTGSNQTMFSEPSAFALKYSYFADVLGLKDKSPSQVYEFVGKFLNSDQYSNARSLADKDLMNGIKHLYEQGEKIFIDNHKSLLEEFEAGSAYDQYHKTAGEVEARNVQKRKNFTEEKRRETPPSKTEDVPRDKQIFAERYAKAGNAEYKSLLATDEATEAARQAHGWETDGETYVEHQLTEQKHLTFMGSKLTGAAKIKSSADVAFLFKNLESAATENIFTVMIKEDGSYSTLYLGTGAISGVAAEPNMIAAAAKELGAKKVVLVHNHPSGSVEPSKEDGLLHKKITNILNGSGVEVMPSVIINLDSGKYGTFTDTDSDIHGKAEAPQKARNVKIYQFDRKKLYVPSKELTAIKSPEDVATFLSKHKRGTIGKLQALIVDNANQVTRYALLDANADSRKLSSDLIAMVGKHGTAVVLLGNENMPRSVYGIKENLKAADVAILDIVEVKQSNDVVRMARSFAAEGYLADKKPEYEATPLEGYTEHEIENFSKSNRIEIAENKEHIYNFVEESLAGNKKGKKLLLGKIRNKTAEKIRKESKANIDLTGFNLELRADEIKHIVNEHGNQSTEIPRGQRGVSIDDVVNIADIVQNFDRVVMAGNNSLRFMKKANGIVSAITLYAEGNKSLSLKTMWVNKSGGLGRASNAKALDTTFKTTSETASATNNIQNISQSGKKKSEDTKFSLTDKADPHVWHGSPHEFKEFDHKHMGTGEGQQAFGWGSYFTDRKDIAEFYAKRNDNPEKDKGEILFNGGKIAEKMGYTKRFNKEAYSRIEGKVAEDILDFMDIKDTIKHYRERINYWTNSEYVREPESFKKEKINEYKKRLDFLLANSDKFKTNSNSHNLYKTRIKGGKSADDLNLMRWDKPPTQEQINAIAANADSKLKPYIENWYKGKNGERYYKLLESHLGSDKAASEFLHSAGIDGIQYPTGYFRSDGVSHEDSYNYVIFNDKDIGIEEHIKFSLAETAGVPDGFPKAEASAKKEWREKGTESRFFKRWFGDSKVVDDDGKPLVVYHGGTFSKSDIPREGMHFGTEQAALRRMKDKRTKKETELNAVYLSIKKPVEVPDTYIKDWSKTIEWAKEKGYDGIVYENKVEDKGSKSYIAFSPSQIKSATDNIGTFDGKNPDIRFSLSAKDKEIADHDPHRRIYTAVRNFISKQGKVGDLDEGIKTYLSNVKNKKGKFRKGLDTLIRDRFADDPPVMAILGYDELEAGERALEIASDYSKAEYSDAEVVERGRAAMGEHDINVRDLAPEDRMANIIEAMPLELDGNAYKGKFELDTKKKESVWNWLKDKLQGKNFKNENTGSKITLSRNGLKELISFIKNDVTYIKSLAHIPEIIKNMRYVETMSNTKDDGYPNFDYYITPAKMDGKNYTILSEVGKNANGEYYYYQNVFNGTPKEVIEKVRDLPTRTLASVANADGAGSPAPLADTSKANPSNSKYNKFLELMQGIYGENFEKYDNYGYTQEKTAESTQNYTEPEETDNGQENGNADNRNEVDKPKGDSKGEMFPDNEKEIAEAERFAEKAKAEQRAKKEKQGELPLEEGEDRYASLRTAPTKWQKGVEKLQDKYNFLKRAEELAPDKTHSPYMKENLMHGKIKTDTAEIVKKGFVDPFTAILKAHDIDYADIDDYAYAMAAEHVNKNLEAKNEYNKQIDSAVQYGFLTEEEAEEMKHRGGSGMSDQEIQEIKEKFKALPATQREAYEKIMNLNRKFNALIDKLEIDSGLISEADAKKRRELMPDYVPMRGLPEDIEAMQSKKQAPTGKGLQVKQDNARRGGRKSRATDVLAQNLKRGIAVIQNAENNIVLEELAKWAEENPSNGIWELDPKIQRLKSDGSGEMEYDQYESEQNNVIAFYREGKRHYIKFNTLQGKAFADNLKGLSQEQALSAMNMLAKLNRVISSNATVYNPNFIVRNGFRDWLDGTLNAYAREGTKAGLTQVWKSPAAIVHLLAGEAGIKNKYSKANEERHDYGGEMGYTKEHTWRDPKEVYANKFKRLEKKGLPKEAAKWLAGFASATMDIWDRINSCIEEGPRVAYYMELRKKGIDPEKATFASKNLTINFDRRGSQRMLSQLYIFANARIQGAENKASMFTEEMDKAMAARARNARIIKAGVTVGMRAVVPVRSISGATGLFALGFIANVLGIEASGDNEDNDRLDIENIEAHTKAGNAVMPLRKLFGKFNSFFDSKYAKLPITQELNFIYNQGRAFSDLLMSKNYTKGDYAVETVNGILDMINITGGGVDIRDLRTTQGIAKSAVNTFAPSGIKPWLDIYGNEDFAKRPIHKDRFNELDKTPNSEMYFDRTNPLFRELAQMINYATGGSAEEAGVIDLSPDDLEYIIKSYFGGIGLLARQAFGIGMSLNQNELPTVNQIPLLNVILAEYNPGRDRNEALGFRSDAYMANKEFMNRAYEQAGAQERMRKAKMPEQAAAEKARADKAQARMDEIYPNGTDLEAYKKFMMHQHDDEFQQLVKSFGTEENYMKRMELEQATKFSKGRKDIRNELAHKEVKAKDLIRNAKTKKEVDDALKIFKTDATKIMNEFGVDMRDIFKEDKDE